VERQNLDLDALIGGWYTAFEAGQAALRSASPDLPLSEIRERTQRLADERAATVGLLDALARDHHERSSLVRLVASPWESKRLLGLPSDAAACVFNLDGVLIGSAAIHAQAWKETFDEFIAGRIDRTGFAYAHFDPRLDYRKHIHARPRLEGVHAFLASRGISLPEGSPDDPPGTETVHGLANRKKLALIRHLDEDGVTPYEGARLYLELARDAGVHCAVVSASANTETMLERAHLSGLIEERVDGNTMVAEHLRRKPSADALLSACRHLGVEPERTAVFETSPDGVAAGRAGGFELIVAVDQTGDGEALRAEGADLVVADLGELLEQRLAA
jgi:HAD superfamily hydrolase (TIGR01509 family)